MQWHLHSALNCTKRKIELIDFEMSELDVQKWLKNEVISRFWDYNFHPSTERLCAFKTPNTGFFKNITSLERFPHRVITDHQLHETRYRAPTVQPDWWKVICRMASSTARSPWHQWKEKETEHDYKWKTNILLASWHKLTARHFHNLTIYWFLLVITFKMEHQVVTSLYEVERLWHRQSLQNWLSIERQYCNTLRAAQRHPALITHTRTHTDLRNTAQNKSL